MPPLYFLLVSPVPEFALWPIAFGVGYFAFAPFGIVQTLPFEMPGLTPREVAVGQSLILTLSTVGPMTAPVIAGLVASRLDYQAGILAVAILPATFALACLFLPETGRRPGEAGAPSEPPAVAFARPQVHDRWAHLRVGADSVVSGRIMLHTGDRDVPLIYAILMGRRCALDEFSSP